MKRLAWIVLGVALIVAVSPAMAQGNKFRVFVDAAYVAPTSSERQDINGTIDDLEATASAGWNVGFEWRATKWFGLELDYLESTLDLEFGGTTLADVAYKPLSLSANFHVVHTKIVDFWVAPTYSYVMWGDVEVRGDNNISTDASNSLGATLGLDLSFFKFMAVNLGLRYNAIDIEPDVGQSTVVNPLMARAGLSFRF